MSEPVTQKRWEAMVMTSRDEVVASTLGLPSRNCGLPVFYSLSGDAMLRVIDQLWKKHRIGILIDVEMFYVSAVYERTDATERVRFLNIAELPSAVALAAVMAVERQNKQKMEAR